MVKRLQQHLKDEALQTAGTSDPAPETEAEVVLKPPKSPRTGEAKIPNKEEYKNKKISEEKDAGKKKQIDDKNKKKHEYVEKKRGSQEQLDNMNQIKDVIEGVARSFGFWIWSFSVELNMFMWMFFVIGYDKAVSTRGLKTNITNDPEPKP